MWLDSLREQLRVAAPPALCVAYSGGTDSTALLHALAQMSEARECGLRALHVDHGLHPDSLEWAAHCVRFCDAINVPLRVLRVSVDTTRGEGIEAAARRARYTAFAESMRDGEWLALAHHRDDQVETVLLKLLRGAGPDGLGGMRARRRFARGILWRPLLEMTRSDLCNYLINKDINGLDDPANADRRFSRNILRHEVLPVIARHWPHADAAILHSARLCRAAAEHLARDARESLDPLRYPDGSLDADGWHALPDALRAPTLDLWLREHALPVPTDAQRRELERQIATAAEDAMPCIEWRGADVRIWDGRLHATPPLVPPPDGWSVAWDGTPLELPVGCGILVANSAHAVFKPPLVVRFRRGGERIRPAGGPHTRELRDLFQQARMPPWLRVRCPLIFEDDKFIAVADLWRSERGEAIFDAQGVCVQWMRPAWLNIP